MLLCKLRLVITSPDACNMKSLRNINLCSELPSQVHLKFQTRIRLYPPHVLPLWEHVLPYCITYCECSRILSILLLTLYGPNSFFRRFSGHNL